MTRGKKEMVACAGLAVVSCLSLPWENGPSVLTCHERLKPNQTPGVRLLKTVWDSLCGN